MKADALELPRRGITVRDARGKLAGYHFAQESLSDDARAILPLAEGLLALVDDLSGENESEAE